MICSRDWRRRASSLPLGSIARSKAGICGWGIWVLAWYVFLSSPAPRVYGFSSWIHVRILSPISRYLCLFLPLEGELLLKQMMHDLDRSKKRRHRQGTAGTQGSFDGSWLSITSSSSSFMMMLVLRDCSGPPGWRKIQI